MRVFFMVIGRASETSNVYKSTLKKFVRLSENFFENRTKDFERFFFLVDPWGP